MKERITYEFTVEEYQDIDHLVDDLVNLIKETNKVEYRKFTNSDLFRNVMASVIELTIKIPKDLEYV